MTRRAFGGFLAASGMRTMLGGRSSPTSRPNVVMLFADDLGYGDLGSYGNTQYQTPQLDRMAAEGARLTEFYAAPTCTPSRASLLTGRYPIRSGMVRVLIPREHFGIPDSEITIAGALKPLGYTTACIGKWHLGDLPPYRPNRHGFDYFYGLLYSNDMSLRLLNFPPLKLFRNESVIETPVKQSTLTQRYTQEAERFMEENRSKPFFLYLPYTMPHLPLAVSQDFVGSSGYGLYGDAVQEIDWSVGRILAALKRLGLEEKTLVVFSSDNGPAVRHKHPAGSTGGLRGGKGTTWEGGVRVPCIARWPGIIPGGGVRSGITSTMDLFTTFLEAAGGEPPEDRVIDGKDILPLLQGRTPSPHDRFYYYSGRHLFAMRQNQWKVHWMKRDIGPHGKPGPPEMCEPRELYDLEADPDETRDTAGTHPEIVNKLTTIATDFAESFHPGKLPPPRWRSLVPARVQKIR